MKNKIVILTMGLLFWGCADDFLELSSLSAISENSFWKTDRDAQLGLNGIYTTLQEQPMYGGCLNSTGNTGLAQYDCFGDNAYNQYEFEGPGNYVEGNADPNLTLFNNKWTTLYRGIGRANIALENLPKIPLSAVSAAKNSEYVAQAKFLRALFYMELAIYYESAPLILKFQKVEDSYVPKNTYEELSAQIIKDLEEAIVALPLTYPAAQYGYATKNAARGLLARFQLYNKNYQAVVDLTAPMIGAFTLEPNYETLFTEAGENSREIVFACRFAQGTDNNGEFFTATFASAPKINIQPMRNAIQSFYTNTGLPLARSNPASLLKANRDPRLGASVFFTGDIYNFDNPVATQTFRSAMTATGFGLKKYVRTRRAADGTGVGSKGGQDFLAIRYADILLMRAEALVELDQPTEVYGLVNQVRQRVSMPTIQNVEGPNRTQLQLRNIVRQERRSELMFEGLRFYDLKRWGTLNVAYLNIINDAVNGYTPVFRGKKSETFAIPLSELDANSNLKQNPAWL